MIYINSSSKIIRCCKLGRSQKVLFQESRFVRKGEKPDISDILRQEPKLAAHEARKKPEFVQKIQESIAKRRVIEQKFRDAGIQVLEWDGDYIDDYSLADDAGKRIETTIRVDVSTEEEISKTVKLCNELGLMPMPIGAMTSAKGVFLGMSKAKMQGLKGVTGAQIKPIVYEEYSKKEAKKIKGTKNEKLKIPRYKKSEYRLVTHQSQSMAILIPLSFKKNSPRVICAAGLPGGAINDFANQVIAEHQDSQTKYNWRIMSDPTSLNELQAGAGFSTGAQGGNRVGPAEDIIRARIVNGDGEIVTAERKDAQLISGLNGAAGIAPQVEYELTAFPKHRHGVFIPISGKEEDALFNILKLQARLASWCQADGDNPRRQLGSGSTGLIITGLELLSKNAIEVATRGDEDSLSKGLNKVMKGHDYGIYLTFSSSVQMDDPQYAGEKFLKEVLGIDTRILDPDLPDAEMGDALATLDQDDETICLVKGKEEYDKVCMLYEEETRGETALGKMDKIRHSAPSRSREEAKKMGGISQSTDFNMRFPEPNEELFREYAKIYSDYIKQFDESDGFEVQVYGHMFPGMGTDHTKDYRAGLNPHVRVTLKLNDPSSRHKAPEMVLKMKKAQSELYQRLFAFVEREKQRAKEKKRAVRMVTSCPEKSRFTTSDYWDLTCLFRPKEAKKYIATVAKYGYSTDSEGKPYRATIAGRMARSIPGTLPRVPVDVDSEHEGPAGVKGLMSQEIMDKVHATDWEVTESGIAKLLQEHWSAAYELAENGHREVTVKRLLIDVAATMHEKWNLSEEQCPLYIESSAEAENILRRNFGDDHGYEIKKISVRDLEELDHLKLPHDDNTVYAVELTGVGVSRGLCVMVTPLKAVREAFMSNVDGTNKAVFRNLYDMWKRSPGETLETPAIAKIAHLGLLLQRDEFDKQDYGKRSPGRNLRPGPGMLSKGIRDGVKALFEEISPGQILDPERQKAIIQTLKDYLGIPDSYHMAFSTSATQMMQLIEDAIEAKQDEFNVIQLNSDAFGDRHDGISKAALDNVDTVDGPWTTSESFYVDRVCDMIKESIEANDEKHTIIFLTTHKTSTGAHCMPDDIIRALHERKINIGINYDLICDVTSGVGAMKYATQSDSEVDKMRIPHTGELGGFQKAMGNPSGWAYCCMRNKLAERLGLKEADIPDFGILQKFKDASNGDVIDPVALAMLGQKLDHENSEDGYTVEEVQELTESLIHIVMAAVENDDKLMHIVQQENGMSKIMGAILAQVYNMKNANRVHYEVFGDRVGDGYGPFSQEGQRLYLPLAREAVKDSKSKEDVEEVVMDILLQLKLVYELKDVSATRGEKVPNIAAREANDPFKVIDGLSQNLTSVDSILLNRGGLNWLGRLRKTQSAVQNGGNGATPGFKDKAAIYANDDDRSVQRNAKAIKDILALEDDGKMGIMEHYDKYKKIEIEIVDEARTYVAANDESQYDATRNSLDAKFSVARTHLASISNLLRGYAISDDSRKDPEGRVVWAYAA